MMMSLELVLQHFLDNNYNCIYKKAFPAFGKAFFLSSVKFHSHKCIAYHHNKNQRAKYYFEVLFSKTSSLSPL